LLEIELECDLSELNSARDPFAKGRSMLVVLGLKGRHPGRPGRKLVATQTDAIASERGLQLRLGLSCELNSSHSAIKSQE
jgi:hypothetical protein